MSPQALRVIDSHTGGEPTRVIVDPPPEFLAGGQGGPQELFDRFLSAVVNEPRGSDVLVGAMLYKPSVADCELGVIFFNNVGTLGMCVHGTIGVVATLAYLGRIKPGTIQIETPVGPVSATLNADGSVSVRNVLSYRFKKDVVVEVPGMGSIRGDIAWGGNWFFLVDQYRETLHLSCVDRLTDLAWRIRQELNRNHITGADGKEIDHIELFGAPLNPGNHSRNFVLCPGKAYDRSPCGTGTSAKMSCLHADRKLLPGDIWRQESILGSVFEGHFEAVDQGIVPTVRGSAYVTADATLLFDARDPFRNGLRT